MRGMFFLTLESLLVNFQNVQLSVVFFLRCPKNQDAPHIIDPAIPICSAHLPTKNLDLPRTVSEPIKPSDLAGVKHLGPIHIESQERPLHSVDSSSSIELQHDKIPRCFTLSWTNLMVMQTRNTLLITILNHMSAQMVKLCYNFAKLTSDFANINYLTSKTPNKSANLQTKIGLNTKHV